MKTITCDCCGQKINLYCNDLEVKLTLSDEEIFSDDLENTKIEYNFCDLCVSKNRYKISTLLSNIKQEIKKFNKEGR